MRNRRPLLLRRLGFMLGYTLHGVHAAVEKGDSFGGTIYSTVVGHERSTGSRHGGQVALPRR